MDFDWRLPTVPFLIGLNAFFVAAEYAVVASRTTHIENLRGGRRRRAADALERLKENPTSAIGAIQVCITLTNLLLGWIGEPAMSAILLLLMSPLVDFLPTGMFRILATTLSFIVVTLLTVVFSELLPKALTLRYVTPVARLTAVPVLGIQRAISPLVAMMNGMANLVTRPLGLGSVDEMESEQHTMEEIRLIASEAAEAGVLTPRERSLVLNSLALGRKTAEQIMVPRIRVAYLDLKKSLDENMAVINQHLYSRLPLCDGGMDRVIGIVYTKEFLAASQEGPVNISVLSLIARPAVFAPVTISLDALLNHFHQQHSHLLILVDEYGGVEGIVTLTDVVDEVLGEMSETPFSATPPDPAHSRDAMVVAGETPIHEIAGQLEREGWGEGHGVTTVSGLVVARLGRIPKAGQHVEVDGVRLCVVESTRQRVERVRLEPLPKDEP